VGNRFELANIRTKLFTTGEENDQNYFNLFPSANVQYKLSDKQDLRLTYSRRIDRPGAWRLNPFPDIADSLNIRSGNPELKPEYIQSLELGQHLMIGTFDLMTTAFYRYTSGVIDYIITVDDGISYGRPENLNHGHDLGFEVIAITPLTPWWDINASYTIYQNRLDGTNVNARFKNDNISWNAKVVSDFTLPWDLKFQISGRYTARGIDAQGTDYARYKVDASILKTFADNKGKISLSCRDLFNTLSFGGTSFGDEFNQRWEFKPESRLVFLSVGFQI
jgi:outer membrane receptor for ferrienterochelin and colicin